MVDADTWEEWGQKAQLKSFFLPCPSTNTSTQEHPLSHNDSSLLSLESDSERTVKFPWEFLGEHLGGPGLELSGENKAEHRAHGDQHCPWWLQSHDIVPPPACPSLVEYRAWRIWKVGCFGEVQLDSQRVFSNKQNLIHEIMPTGKIKWRSQERAISPKCYFCGEICVRIRERKNLQINTKWKESATSLIQHCLPHLSSWPGNDIGE